MTDVGTARRHDRTVGLWSTLVQRDFALLWMAGLLSNLGTWATFIAIPVFVFTTTGSELAATLIFTASVVPRLLGSIAGVLVDRHDRRRVLIMANLILAVLTVPLLVVQTGQLWMVYVAVFALNLVGLVIAPAENALLPNLVSRERLLSANALNALNDNLARIFGPAIGAIVLAGGGFVAVVALNAATFVISAALVMLLKPRPRADAEGVDRSATGGWWSAGRAGVTTLLASAVAVAVAVSATGAIVADSIYSSLLGPLTVDVLAADGAFLGLFLAIRGVGGLIGSLIIGPPSRRLGPLPTMGVSIVGLGLVLAGIITVPHPSVALIGAGLSGIFVVGWTANQQTLIQTQLPATHLGRSYGTLGTLGAAAMIIGSVVAGPLAELAGVAPALYAASAAYLVAGGTAVIWSLRLHQRRSVQ